MIGFAKHNMKKIIRTEEKVEGGLYVEYILGTNIFSVNSVKREMDLEIEFVKILSRSISLSAHTGMLLDFGDDPVELFGDGRGQPNYEEVNVGTSQGSFYNRRDWPHFPPCFFPEVNAAFWNLIKPEIDFTWRKLLYYDALAFCVAPDESNYLVQINSLFREDFVSTEKWIKEALKIYRLIITSVGDMNYYKVCATDPANFEILSKAIHEIENIVRTDHWYQENMGALVWDGERSMSLKLGP